MVLPADLALSFVVGGYIQTISKPALPVLSVAGNAAYASNIDFNLTLQPFGELVLDVVARHRA